MSRTQELEATVHRLQSRLTVLQNGAGPSHLVGYPGPSSNRSARSSPFSESSSNDASPTFPASISGSHSSSSSEGSSQRDRMGRSEEEPPVAMIHMLLQCFLPHATQFGFFLHPQRFYDSALQPFAIGDERRPSPALLYAAYLWGAHLSRSQPLLSSEGVFLKRAKRHISTEISSHTNPARLLHTIQAQVLLSTYLLRNKRFLEAEFYANGAATVALGYQLHKIRSSRPVTAPQLGAPQLEVYPTPPADVVEEGERIRAFWAVGCLQSQLNLALDAASASFCIFESPGASGIDTPWPLDIEDYENGTLPPGYQSQETIRHFLTDDTFTPSPIPTLYAKASVLLYRATRLGASWSPGTFVPQAIDAYQTSYTWLDRRITAFWQALPPIYAFYGNSAAARTLVVTHALAAAAAIRLHRSPAASDAEAQGKCLFAARSVFDVLGDVRVGSQSIAHPVVGALCALACQTMMDEVQRTQTWGSAGRSQEAELRAELGVGMRTMRLILMVKAVQNISYRNWDSSTRRYKRILHDSFLSHG
ncbi:hypothetical protein MSAN_02499300 [Mycena sanguinolenta]|uniref:Transcription factor domain-containing protein n=1 Tax=Mycena sanguinolenta TaxID=230812 RepID=A0A8H6TZ65_9AGAR|nr:hypothetical protein MSAN_02499300 [Mycena sanguinolenta]